MISIWLNIGAMKLQYYEEIIKYSSIQITEQAQSGEDTEEDDNGNVTQSASREENSSDSNACHRSPQSLTSHEWKLLNIVIIWMSILSVTSLSPIDKNEMKFVVGVAVNVNLVFFYAAPLSSIMTVLRTKSSASIHKYTMIMNTVNSFFWCVYSLAIQDYYILIPNGLGFGFGITQMLLCTCYPQNDAVGGGGTEQFLDEDGSSRDDSQESQTEIT